jgi:hypothetical protein
MGITVAANYGQFSLCRLGSLSKLLYQHGFAAPGSANDEQDLSPTGPGRL